MSENSKDDIKNKSEKTTEQEKNNLKNFKKGDKKFNFYYIYLLIAVILIALYYFNAPKIEEITMTKFEKMALRGDIEKVVVVNNEFAEIYIKPDSLKNDTLYKNLTKNDRLGNIVPHFTMKFLTVESFENKIKEIEQTKIQRDTVGKSIEEKEKIIQNSRIEIIPETRKNWLYDIFSWIFPIAVIVIIWLLLMRSMNKSAGGGGNIFSVGKAKPQLFDKDSAVKINFNDVAGLDEAKVEVVEIIDFLKNPKKYTELGGKIPKGVLLVGPPGTGKTLLAKAVAGEAKVPFFSISGSDFVEMFVGVGASRVRDLFKQAKEKAPCIIFIDEIDAIGRARGRHILSGANDERENTLNQLLTEMDGFSTNNGVIILAATNRADILDKALMRAGRFDRLIYVELPDLKGREDIFKVHLRPLKLGDDIDASFLAKQTPGFSGADIANVCNEAALIAARNNKKKVEKEDFLAAIDRIIGGLEKRNKIISAEEKRVIAFHEAGHASVGWMLKYAHPLVKVTIVPRGKALGAAWYLPDERQISNFDQILDEMTATLGGRAAEEVIFGKVSTGALNDLERVTKQAYAAVAYFGLNEKLGNLSFFDSTGQQEYLMQRPYSEKTAELIDEEVRKLVEVAYKRAKDIIIMHREKVEKLAEQLLTREVIFKEDVEEIFGKRETAIESLSLPTYKEYLKQIEQEETKETEREKTVVKEIIREVLVPAQYPPQAVTNATDANNQNQPPGNLQPGQGFPPVMYPPYYSPQQTFKRKRGRPRKYPPKNNNQK